MKLDAIDEHDDLILTSTILIILLVGLVARLLFLDSAILGGDELGQAIVAEAPSIKAVLRGAASHAGAAPLDYLLLHAYINVFGSSDFSARVPAVLYGVLTIVLLYLLAQDVVNKITGIISAFLLAISPIHIEFSQTARFYSLFVFLSLLSILFFIRIVRTHDRLAWGGYFVSTLLSLYTHYYTVFVIASEVLFLGCLIVSNRLPIRNLLRFLLIIGFVGLLFTPWLPEVLADANISSESKPPSTLTIMKTILLGFINGQWETSQVQGPLTQNQLISLIPFCIFFLLGFTNLIYHKNLWVLLLIFWMALPVPIVNLLVIKGRYFWAARQFLFLLPPFLIIVANGITSIARWSVNMHNNQGDRTKGRSRIMLLRVFPLILVIAVIDIAWISKYSEIRKTRQPSSQLINLAKAAHPGDLILVESSRPRLDLLAWTLARFSKQIQFLQDELGNWDVRGIKIQKLRGNIVLEDVNSLLSGFDGVWVVRGDQISSRVPSPIVLSPIDNGSLSELSLLHWNSADWIGKVEIASDDKNVYRGMHSIRLKPSSAQVQFALISPRIYLEPKELLLITAMTKVSDGCQPVSTLQIWFYDAGFNENEKIVSDPICSSEFISTHILGQVPDETVYAKLAFVLSGNDDPSAAAWITDPGIYGNLEPLVESVLESQQKQTGRVTLNRDQHIGQSFIAGDEARYISAIEVVVDPKTWAPGENLSLSLWDSTAHNELLTSATVSGIDRDENPWGIQHFELDKLVPVIKDNRYYFELNHSSSKDDGVDLLLTTDPASYGKGTMWLNDQIKDADLWFSIIGIEPDLTSTERPAE